MPSAAPAAVTYLLALAQNTLPDAYVVFRKKLGVFSAPLTVEINGFEGTELPAELSPEAKREEEFVIPGSVSSLQGDDDLIARMNEAEAAWGLLRAAIGVDYTLGGTVRWAQVTEYQFTPDIDSGGQSLGTIEFRITCQQRIASLT